MYLEPGKDITLFNADGTRHIKDSESLCFGNNVLCHISAAWEVYVCTESTAINWRPL